MYNFDKTINRQHTGSCKWDCISNDLLDQGIVPMTVADMEFEIAPEIKSALLNAVEHSICGYTQVDSEYMGSLAGFMKRHHGLDVEYGNLICTSGIVQAFGIVIRALTNVGDGIILQPPVYTPFFDAIKQNNRTTLENPLIYNNGEYSIDFEGLESLCKKGAKLLMFCSPHNPVGRVWTIEELEKVGEICKKYSVLILCDEIHNDIVYADNKHISLATLPNMKDITITCTAMSKTFNLAGLMLSNLFVYDKDIHQKLDKQVGIDGSHCIPYFGRAAAIAAFKDCDLWIMELLSYLQKNIELCYDFFANEVKGISCTKAEGTYLLWLNCTALGLTESELKELFYEKAKIPANMGSMFGTGGEGFVRLNIALPREKLVEALQRLKAALAQ